MTAVSVKQRIEVALLAEGVDRNADALNHPRLLPVALLAEGVDRNGQALTVAIFATSRPPRGGRG